MVADMTGLRTVAGLLSQSGIRFALGGSGLLHCLGLTDSVRDWDITTDAPALAVREALHGIPIRDIDTGDHPFASAYHLLAVTGGTETDIIGSFAIRTGVGTCRLPTLVTEYLDGIPVGSPEVWAVAYRLMGRHPKADLLNCFLMEKGARASVAEMLLGQPLPPGVAAEVSAWPVR